MNTKGVELVPRESHQETNPNHIISFKMKYNKGDKVWYNKRNGKSFPATITEVLGVEEDGLEYYKIKITDWKYGTDVLPKRISTENELTIRDDESSTEPKSHNFF